jgi:hypothetical protein
MEEIHNSLVNGQRTQMVKQIQEYGLYNFWQDYWNYLTDFGSENSAIEYFKDATISYFRITNR